MDVSDCLTAEFVIVTTRHADVIFVAVSFRSDICLTVRPVTLLP